jgi:hypothetical protein
MARACGVQDFEEIIETWSQTLHITIGSSVDSHLDPVSSLITLRAVPL